MTASGIDAFSRPTAKDRCYRRVSCKSYSLDLEHNPESKD
jgi:hypothetical protein